MIMIIRYSTRPDKNPNLIVSPMMKEKDKPYFADAFPYLMLSRWKFICVFEYLYFCICIQRPYFACSFHAVLYFCPLMVLDETRLNILIPRPSLSELNVLLEREGVDLEVEEKRWKQNSNSNHKSQIQISNICNEKSDVENISSQQKTSDSVQTFSSTEDSLPLQKTNGLGWAPTNIIIITIIIIVIIIITIITTIIS